jgi:tetratricopeptide (TPR) repeat protein
VAVARDPGFARAWAGLADAYLAAPVYAGASPRESWPRARDAIQRALALDASMAEAHTSLAYGTMLYEWDWTSAEASFRRAIAANPSYATAHHWYADFLAGRGRLEEALREMRRARDLDPLSPLINVELGWVLGLLRRADEALEQVEQVLRVDPGFAHAHFVRGLMLTARGEHVAAITAERRALELGGFYAFAYAALACAHAAAGERAEATRLVAELEERARGERVPPFAFALAYTGLGQIDDAFAGLDRGISERDELLAENFLDPLFDLLRGDERYDRVLAALGAVRTASSLGEPSQRAASE